MLLLDSRAAMMRALTLDLDPQLLQVLASRVATLRDGEFDLLDVTEILIVESGDTEVDIVRQVGFSPLVEPIDGARFPAPGFYPFWDWLVTHPGWFELSVSFGSAFSYILFIEETAVAFPMLQLICRQFSALGS